MVKGFIFDGQKNIGLEQYPAAAWTDLRGDGTIINDSRHDTMPAQGLYETVAVLYRCVEIRANALTRIPWVIMNGDDEVWHSRDHQPPAALAHLRNFRRLLWNTEACICLAPEAFWFHERNRARTIRYKWLAPTSVLPVWDTKDGLIGFDRTTDGGTRRFDVDDIVYLPRLNPMHETSPGRPPAQAAMASAGVIYNVDTFAAGFFERGAIKATLLTIDGNPAQPEIERLEKWWKRFFSGVKNAWESAAVRMGVKPVVVGEGIAELGNTELTEEKRQDIATGMGVMHSLLFSNSANFATAEQDAMNYQALTMIPELEIIFEWLNEQIFEPQGMFIKERSEEMSIFQRDENERGDALKKYVEAGVQLSVAAEILGIDLPAGMEYADLEPEEPEPPQQFEVIEPQPAALIEDTQAVEQEKARFRRWVSKRKNPAPSAYESQLLTDEMKYAILDELVAKGGKDAAAEAASFPVGGWESYP